MKTKIKIITGLIAVWIMSSFVYTASALERKVEIKFNRPKCTTHTIEEIKGLCELKDLDCSWEKKEVAKEEPKKTVSVEAEIRKIAKEKCKDMGDFCIDDLVAMAWVESRFNCNAVGDSGKSIGCYQIHLGYHKNIKKEQAKNLDFAIDWTLNRLKSKGYPKYRSIAIMSHNGTPNTSRTLAFFER